MKILTLATRLNAPLRLYTGSPDMVAIKHLPDPVAAAIAPAPRGHLLAWSAADLGVAGFTQNLRSVVLPFPMRSAGIGSMQPAKGRGFVMLYARTSDTGMIHILGSETFQQDALDGLLAQQAALGELLGCTLSVDDWGFDC
ncbi:hypothetical protein [Stenotrophomonas sp.]|uniref:hypothetical protein n=1 Tax=Stenotrophomonas sp. TaxID=69392 RepID=UPI002D29574E|nr:hypothetical protein [Stenotrophomonas sp.]HYQ24364.1 hypothetical protein [Stenotrophomonas sp.]